jgi:hypothetical protein
LKKLKLCKKYYDSNHLYLHEIIFSNEYIDITFI